MADNVLGALFSNQAEAIREGLGDIGKIKPADMPDRIRDIVALIGTGGGSGESSVTLRSTAGEIWTDQTGIYRQTVEHGLGVMPDLIMVYNANLLGISDAQRAAWPMMYTWSIHSKLFDAFSGLSGALGYPDAAAVETSVTSCLDNYRSNGLSCPDERTFKFSHDGSSGTAGLLIDPSLGVAGWYRWIAITGLGGGSGASALPSAESKSF